jgi:hypothetical protein
MIDESIVNFSLSPLRETPRLLVAPLNYNFKFLVS